MTRGCAVVDAVASTTAYRQPLPLPALITGAGQEHGRRAGAENVPAIVGFGAAAALVDTQLPIYATTVQALRDRLEAQLQEQIPGLLLNGHPTERLPNTLNVSLPGVNAAALLAQIRTQAACSTGSAWHAGHAAPSAVLLAMGVRCAAPQPGAGHHGGRHQPRRRDCHGLCHAKRTPAPGQRHGAHMTD